MKNVIQDKVVQNVENFITSTHFVQKHCENLAKVAKRKLRSSMLQIAKQVSFELDETECLIGEKGNRLDLLQKRQMELETCLGKSRALRGRLNGINIGLKA